MRNAYLGAGNTKLPFTFYFAASLIYLSITIASMIGQQRIEAWSRRGVREV
jgi:ABC-type arginine transport system permease subunit